MAKRRIEGSRALITGASSGIGRALAIELARHGAHVVLLARRQALLDEVADQIRRFGSQVAIVAGDVTDPAVRQAALHATSNSLGGLDMLINNAGVTAHGLFESAAPDRLRHIMELNFFAAAELIRITLPVLKKGNHPIVVNMGSILGHRAIPYNSEYCASKFALRGLSESLRAELSKHGIDLLVVSPGTTDTEFFHHALERREALPWTARSGASASQVAKATLRAIRRGRHEIIPHAAGRVLVYLNRVAPRLVDWWMERY
jgi:short-subunit dehydrogenase